MSLLEVQEVSKAFGGIRALDTCSISVEQGSITGLIGPNGSGKTTLFNVMTGYERIDAGQVRFGGQTITNAPPDKVFRLGVGRTFQLTRIFPRLTVLENMHVAVQRNDLKACSAGGVRPTSTGGRWNCWTLWGLWPSRTCPPATCPTGRRSCWSLPSY